MKVEFITRIESAGGACVMAGEDSREGAFTVPFRGRTLRMIASHGMDWDHVSVSLSNRCPNWEEMCFVKSLFWDDEECVMQLHPPKSQWVNNHPFCLHLWKPQSVTIPLPPSIMVGIKEVGVVDTPEKIRELANAGGPINCFGDRA